MVFGSPWNQTRRLDRVINVSCGLSLHTQSSIGCSSSHGRAAPCLLYMGHWSQQLLVTCGCRYMCRHTPPMRGDLRLGTVFHGEEEPALNRVHTLDSKSAAAPEHPSSWVWFQLSRFTASGYRWPHPSGLFTTSPLLLFPASPHRHSCPLSKFDSLTRDSRGFTEMPLRLHRGCK